MENDTIVPFASVLYTMSHLIPFKLPMLVIDIIITVITMIMVVLIMREGGGRILVK